MKRFHQRIFAFVLGAGIAAFACGTVLADDGRPGTVQWSNGRKVQGAISVTQGKDLRMFVDGELYSVKLDEVKEIRFKAMNEELFKGFYFATAGQDTKTYTGEVYPIRDIEAQITLLTGKVLEGKLYPMMLYLTADDVKQKVIVVAKQTGANGQSLADLVYPSDILFDTGGSAANVTQVDLSQAALVNPLPPVIVIRPDLTQLAMDQTPGKQVWVVPSATPEKVLFGVTASDGIHVSWPLDVAPAPAYNADVEKAVNDGIGLMREFYDTRTLLGCYLDGDDVYSLVMMKRLGTTAAIEANMYTWNLFVLHWKYDADTKKVTGLLNRISLATDHARQGSEPPPVIKEAGYLKYITAVATSSVPSPAPGAPSASNTSTSNNPTAAPSAPATSTPEGNHP
jgi:hypothetical protein